MKTTLAELGIGVATALVSILLVTGALLMSFTEGRPAAALPPASTPTTAGETQAPSPSAPALSPTFTPTLTCDVPLGWREYTLQPGDTWESLAALAGASIEQLRLGNCNFSGSLIPGSVFNLPQPPSATPIATPTATSTAERREDPGSNDTPVPFDTPTATACPIPAGWIAYTVRSGDTLYMIGLRYNLAYTEIMRANCLPSTYIYSGQVIYVPNVPPVLSPTHTLQPTEPPPPPPTNTPVPPTDIPTPEPTTEVPTDPPPPTVETTAPPPATTEPAPVTST